MDEIKTTHAPKPKVSQGSGDNKESVSSVRKSVFFLLIVGVLYFLYLVISGQLGTFMEALAGVDNRWVLFGVFCYVCYYFLGVLAYAIAVIGDPKSPLGIADLMSVEATGIFFSNLTPNGAGGAPAQIVRLTKSGLSAGAAGALQYTRFIVYEAAEGIFAALMLIPRMSYFVETYGNVFFIGFLLFGFKIVEVGGLLLICLFPNIVRKVGNALLGFMAKHNMIKRYDHWNHLINEQVEEFSEGFRAGAGNWKLMLWTLLVTMLQLSFQYTLPWVTLKAFGRTGDFLTCLACGSMLELLTSAVPLPGGTGGAEGGFAFLFGGMFGPALTAGFVVWRMVGYILPVLASVPLMGLRTRGGYALNSRIRRLRQKYDTPARRQHRLEKQRLAEQKRQADAVSKKK